MYGHHRNSGIHTLANYNEAFHKWETTKPIRGRGVDVRPLGHRRSADQYKIELLPEGGVACVLYKTPVVTFFEDGDIRILNDNWNSVSTCNFIDEILWSVTSRIYNNDLYVRTKQGEFALGEGGIWLRMNAQGELEVKLDALPPKYVHAIDRKKANNVRAQYKPFLDYVSRMSRLKGNDPYLHSEMVRVFPHPKFPNALDTGIPLNNRAYDKWTDSVRNLFTLMNSRGENQHDNFYKALLLLAKSYGNHKYHEPEGYVVTEKKVRVALDDLIIGFHRDEILVQKQVPLGVARRDSNAKYFRDGWRRLHEA
jgi:hypothetical protein